MSSSVRKGCGTSVELEWGDTAWHLYYHPTAVRCCKQLTSYSHNFLACKVRVTRWLVWSLQARTLGSEFRRQQEASVTRHTAWTLHFFSETVHILTYNREYSTDRHLSLPKGKGQRKRRENKKRKRVCDNKKIKRKLCQDEKITCLCIRRNTHGTWIGGE